MQTPYPFSRFAMSTVLHQPTSHTFASDNYSGVHPDILAAITAANGGHTTAYGGDPYTAELQRLVQQEFGEHASAWPVFNGTGANVLALQAALPRWGAVICAESGHINVDESTAPQAVGGFKLWPIHTPDGKLTPALIDQEAHGYGFEHRAQPLVVSITQSTELGTVYSLDELKAISAHCRQLGITLHMDGARLANAAASLGVSLRTITTEVGVDILSFGGTKNGLLLGECVVILNPKAVPPENLLYLRKMNLQLASKMRFISAQFVALLQNQLWQRTASHANNMAHYLQQQLCALPHVELVYPTQANAVFVRFPAGIADKLREYTHFYDWDRTGTVRFVCSFDTQKEHVEALVSAARALLTTP